MPLWKKKQKQRHNWMQFITTKQHFNSFQPRRRSLNLITAFQFLSFLFQGRLITKMAQLSMLPWIHSLCNLTWKLLPSKVVFVSPSHETGLALWFGLPIECSSVAVPSLGFIRSGVLLLAPLDPGDLREQHRTSLWGHERSQGGEPSQARPSQTSQCLAALSTNHWHMSVSTWRSS